jgi:hypothetical protein
MTRDREDTPLSILFGVSSRSWVKRWPPVAASRTVSGSS